MGFPTSRVVVNEVKSSSCRSVDREAVRAACAPPFGETLLGASHDVVLGQRNEAAVLVDDQTFAIWILRHPPE